MRDYHKEARAIFARAPFIQHLGLTLVSASDERVVAEMDLQPWMRQQTGVAHAGIVTALADHVAACAARLNAPADETFVSIDVHTTFVRPAAGPVLRAVGAPVRVGKRVSFAHAEVFSGDKEPDTLCATFKVSLILAPSRPGS